MNKSRLHKYWASLLLLCIATQAQAAEYVSWLAVRYQDHSVKTFIQGPYGSRPQCDKLNQTTWDNVQTACGICTAEAKFCLPAPELAEVFAKALRSERAAFPYVIATPKGRIIVSGVATDAAIAECQRLGQQFRVNGYSEARCVLP
jgi:hypothetical protein